MQAGVIVRPLSSLKGHGEQGRSLMTGERLGLHPSTKRVGRMMWGTAGQSASVWSLRKTMEHAFLDAFFGAYEGEGDLE